MMQMHFNMKIFVQKLAYSIDILKIK